MTTRTKTPPIPHNADELEEMLGDDNALRDVLADPGKFREFIANYKQTVLNKDPEILDQVKSQTEKFMIDWLRDNSDAKSMMNRLRMDDGLPSNVRRQQTALYNKAADGAKYDDYFTSPANFLHSISNRVAKDDTLTRKLHTLQNDLSSIKPSDGGFLIPEILRAELLRTALENAVVRSRARVIPMDSLTVPFPTVDSTSNVSSVFGGVIGFWTEEGATLAESQPRFGRMELRAQKLTLYTEVPNELIYDAIPAFNAFIGDMFPEAIAWFEDVGFTTGTGVGEPLGYLNAPASISVTRTAGGNDVEWADIVKMYARMLPQSLSRAVWLVSPDTLPSIFQMVIGAGTSPIMLGNTGTFTNAGSVTPPMSMLGLPIIVTEKVAATGTAGDVNLVDFGYYLLGDRQAMSARQSEEFRFQNDLTAFRVIERVDGRPWLASAITPKNGGATLSPFIKLA